MSHPGPKSLLPGGDGDMYLRGKLKSALVHFASILIRLYGQVLKEQDLRPSER